MLDIRKIKENPDAIKAGMKAKEVDCDAIVDRILELDVQVRALKTHTESQTACPRKTASSSVRRRVPRSGARMFPLWKPRLLKTWKSP